MKLDTIHLRDCLEGLKELPSDSIDLVATRLCPICNTVFTVYSSRLKHGRGVTCSRKCKIKWTSRPRSGLNIVCPVCGDFFYRVKSKLKRIKHRSVCSLKCLYRGRSVGIIKRIVTKPYKSKPITRFSKPCKTCGEPFETIPSLVKEGKGKYCSRRCFEIMHSINMRGKGSPSYIDGRSKNKRTYRGNNWDQIRKTVYKRDNYYCQICGRHCGKRIIQAHHIIPYKVSKDNSLGNLTTLCVYCHGVVEGRRLMKKTEVGLCNSM